MSNNIESFDDAHKKKLQNLSKEERAKLELKKLAQEIHENKDSIKEPKGLTSGKQGPNGKMIIDLEEDYDDEKK